MLKVINLKKKFNSTEVLKGVSFDVSPGEIAVVLGKSGAGKTTLMRCINGLEAFDSGKIIVDDIEINTSSDYKKIRGQIGMVFQNFNLFPHLTVLENIIESPLNVFNKDKNEIVELAEKLLEMVDLMDKKDSYPYELSGGQQQRVAIARSCALTPKILCFDEPTSALDQDNIEKIIEIINVFKKKGMAILIITHDPAFSRRIADKTINIENGLIIDKLMNS
ncbi:amino acid ABC transporter ATP-binding protein [Erysipelothrix rhusiopathiae]|uniref:amino acid ABC transporter ATP-binding protein n=2 Tax=Erysipelothrix rhusiopathiae TaxID=1648 RepID=UPI002FBF10BA